MTRARLNRQALTLAGFVLAVTVTSGDMHAQAMNADTLALSGDIPLLPGDAVQLRFWREPELNGEYTVDNNGRVVLPILGGRSVIGIPPEDLQHQLRQDYERQLNNQTVGITLLRRIRILGAVRNPGLYHINPTMTLSDALALAGGATSDGKLSGIKILRGQTQFQADAARSRYLTEQLRSGDQILVPERSWISRNSRVIVGGLLSAAAIVVVRAAFNN